MIALDTIRTLELCSLFFLVALASWPMQTSAQGTNPVSACKSCFINGQAPTGIPSPVKGTKLVPLCHSKGSSVFFYTVYDPSVLHALMSAQLVQYSVLPKCVGTSHVNSRSEMVQFVGIFFTSN